MSTTAKPDALPREVLQDAYDLGAWDSCERLPGGKNQHYHVRTARGEYVLRRSHRSKTTGGMRFEHELIAHLRRGGFPAPEVVPATSRESFVEADGRLYCVSVFVRGARYEPGNAAQLRTAARALATYHGLAATFSASAPVPDEPRLHETLRKRVAAIPPDPALGELAARYEHDARVCELLAAASYARCEGEAVLAALDRLYPALPTVTIHAGCRRGSALFDGDRLIAVLDFDSARYEARAVDLAVALHDFAKVYGDASSPDYKVPLDAGVVSSFLDAYREVTPLDPVEVEALPALLVAKRLKRALGRYDRLFAGEPLSEGDLRKMTLEIARVRRLEVDDRELEAALASGAEAGA